MKQRLDRYLVVQGLAPTRSQAESTIRLGDVTVDGEVITKPGFMVGALHRVRLAERERFVSRAGLKLASVASKFQLDFTGKLVLDVGSSTGGFTEFALKHGAHRVVAVDVGTDQMHPSVSTDPRVELHERTDIRDFVADEPVDLVVIDVSFISLRQILVSVKRSVKSSGQIVAMVKPQFEAQRTQLTAKGIVKNDGHRRRILRDFEQWARGEYRIADKADSGVRGSHGNLERFYLLTLKRNSTTSPSRIT